MKDEMDILREISSIAAAHGSIALSQILEKKISLQLPSLDFISTETALGKINTGQIVISVSSHILTGLKGNILFVLDEKSAFKLIDMCYKLDKKYKKLNLLTEMGISVIKEVGAVVIAAYVGALNIILKKLVIPSIPTLVSGPIQDVIGIAVRPYDNEEYLLLIEAVFEEMEQKIRGSFYLILSSAAMQDIQSTCKKLLKSLEKKSKR